MKDYHYILGVNKNACLKVIKEYPPDELHLDFFREVLWV